MSLASSVSVFVGRLSGLPRTAATAAATRRGFGLELVEAREDVALRLAMVNERQDRFLCGIEGDIGSSRYGRQYLTIRPFIFKCDSREGSGFALAAPGPVGCTDWFRALWRMA
jgi:hypothetical protein